MKVTKIRPYGFCKGVIDAIKIAKETKLQNPNTPITILGMLVHNNDVILDLENLGIKTIHDDTKSLSELLKEIKEGIVIFTAHGHDKFLEKQANEQGLTFIDATCKFVTFNNNNIIESIKNGYEVIYIGKLGHLETNATLSIDDNICLYDVKKGLIKKPKTDKIIVYNQTTLSLLDLKEIHQELKEKDKNLIIGDEICGATRKRQEQLLNCEEDYDLIIIVGDSKSNNTLSLYNIAKSKFVKSTIYRVRNLNELLQYDLKNATSALILTGTSTPSEFADEIENFLIKK